MSCSGGVQNGHWNFEGAPWIHQTYSAGKCHNWYRIILTCHNKLILYWLSFDINLKFSPSEVKFENKNIFLKVWLFPIAPLLARMFSGWFRKYTELHYGTQQVIPSWWLHGPTILVITWTYHLGDYMDLPSWWLHAPTILVITWTYNIITVIICTTRSYFIGLSVTANDTHTGIIVKQI